MATVGKVGGEVKAEAKTADNFVVKEIKMSGLVKEYMIDRPEGLLLVLGAITGTVESMREEQQGLNSRLDEIVNEVDDEAGMTEEQDSEFKDSVKRIEALGRMIEAQEARDKMKQGAGARSREVTQNVGTGQRRVEAQAKDHKWGFASLGNMAQAVRVEKCDRGAAERLAVC